MQLEKANANEHTSVIRDLRSSRNLTQQQFSDITGVSIRTIQNWESGINKCPKYVEKLIVESFLMSDEIQKLRKKINALEQEKDG